MTAMTGDSANELVLHSATQRNIEQYLAQPRHGLLLIGPTGAGKLSVAKTIISRLLETNDISKNPAVLHIKPAGNSISIDEIRQANQFVRLKTTGHKPWRRAIVVEDAHRLTTEAQNAFLKLLEEPPADTVIVLTSASRDALLPTITSRTQIILVKPADQDSLVAYFSTKSDANNALKAYYMSRGQPGLMYRLLNKDTSDSLLQTVDIAKAWLQADTFNRLVTVDELIRQKQDLTNMLWALQTVSQAALRQAANKQNTILVKKWQKILKSILVAQDSMPSNPLPKLLLTNLALQI